MCLWYADYVLHLVILHCTHLVDYFVAFPGVGNCSSISPTLISGFIHSLSFNTSSDLLWNASPIWNSSQCGVVIWTAANISCFIFPIYIPHGGVKRLPAGAYVLAAAELNVGEGREDTHLHTTLRRALGFLFHGIAVRGEA